MNDLEGLTHKISMQDASTHQVQMTKEQLAHIDRLNALGEMASSIAHEINQPLAAISLFAQAGKRLLEAGKHEDVQDVFDKLSQHAQRAGVIIERIQSMVKQPENEKKLSDCATLVQEVVELAQSEARIYDIDIKLTIAKSLPIVLVDSVQIQQVVLNLLRNGMQAMQALDCRYDNVIELRASLHNGDKVKFAIIDSGSGMPTESSDNIFDPFCATKKSKLGMGLPISRSIIEAHDGHINYYNNTHGGATFYFILPAVIRDFDHGK
jgi:two-component system sensor kinase FixL